MKPKVRKLYSQGKTTREVASLFQIGHATVYRWCKDIIRNKKQASRKGEEAPQYKGGYITQDGYRMLTKEGKQILEHRKIMKAPKGYVVHHKNGNRSDNRIENLEILTRKQHLLLHMKLEKHRYVVYGRTHTQEYIEKMSAFATARKRNKDGRFLPLSN